MNLEWDHFSDQPHIIKDKSLKRRIYKKARIDFLKTITLTAIFSPIIAIRYLLPIKKEEIDINSFFSMSVNLDKESFAKQRDLIDELEVNSILIRVPLSDMKNLQKYVEFAKEFKDKEILINILQDRAHIDDLELLREDIKKIFFAFDFVTYFQVANAINRKKWAFFTIREYLEFYEVIQNIRDEKFQNIKLIGSSVIDFEYHYTIRTLFNFKKVHYDIFSSLLYVDRRRSPENRQMGFDLKRKIRLLKSIISLSPKSSNRVFITETNWPIINTAPYAPTSQKECVSLDDYALFMVQYYLITLSTKSVERVYWHQLIAPGYGLLDHRDGIKKYPAFYAYKTMVKFLKDTSLIEFNLDTKIKFFKFQNRQKSVLVYWSDEDLKVTGDFNIYGEKFRGGKFCYIIKDGATGEI